VAGVSAGPVSYPGDSTRYLAIAKVDSSLRLCRSLDILLAYGIKPPLVYRGPQLAVSVASLLKERRC
jgi:hypothetical protein